LSLPLDQIANYSVATLAFILFYLFATQVVKGVLKEIKKSVENNTEALHQIREVMIKCRKGED
jgi:hypothetical protein